MLSSSQRTKNDVLDKESTKHMYKKTCSLVKTYPIKYYLYSKQRRMQNIIVLQIFKLVQEQYEEALAKTLNRAK